MRTCGGLLMTMLMIGCNENELHSTMDLGVAKADIEVEPTLLNFGTLASTDEPAVMSFDVTNIGSMELTLEGLDLDGSSFSLLTNVTNRPLEAGETISVDVSFTPNGSDEQTGSAWVLSNVPDNSSIPVDLIGYGAVPDLEISPSLYDFGIKPIGCADDQEITLTNVGGDVLEVSDIQYTGDSSLSLDSSIELPLYLNPGESRTVAVDFLPTTVAHFNGQIQVISNDPQGDVFANQTAEGDYGDVVEDLFDIPTNPPVDLLFAVDQSCSMDDDSVTLGASFSEFITDISAFTSDWHIGVATLDSGCFNSGILKYNTTNYVSKFQNAVTLGDDAQYNTERLFGLVDTALSRTGNSDCNANFLRDDALLHIIFVSDEQEQSDGALNDWLTQLKSYKSDPSLVKMSAITLPTGMSDDSYVDWIMPDRYWDAVDNTGGELLSLLSTDWTDHVEALATASMSGVSEFDLSQAPIVPSIQVFVDGMAAAGWHYDAGLNKVVFDAAVEGHQVRVTYAVPTACD